MEHIFTLKSVHGKKKKVNKMSKEKLQFFTETLVLCMLQFSRQEMNCTQSINHEYRLIKVKTIRSRTWKCESRPATALSVRSRVTFLNSRFAADQPSRSVGQARFCCLLKINQLCMQEQSGRTEQIERIRISRCNEGR